MSEPAPEEIVWDLLREALGTQARAIACRLGVPDVLTDGPRPVADVAREAGVEAATLEWRGDETVVDDDDPAHHSAAAADEARLPIIDNVLPEGNEPDGAKWLDLLLLALLGGKERKEARWRALLRAGGFKPIRFNEVLIEARPA